LKVVLGQVPTRKLPTIPLEEIVENALAKQQQRVGKLQVDNCIHSRKLMALLDLSEKEMEFKNYILHIEKCLECQNRLAKAKNLQGIIQENIPVYQVFREELDSFKSELDELAKNLIKMAPSKRRTAMTVGKNIFEDVLRTLFRPQMFIIYALAVGVGGLIKYVIR